MVQVTEIQKCFQIVIGAITMLPETALSGILIRMPKSLEKKKKVLFNQPMLPDQKS